MSWIRTIWARKAAWKQLRSLLPALRKLRKELSAISEVRDPLGAIVALFRTVSPWHDRSHEIGELTKLFRQAGHQSVANRLEVLMKHFQNAGRDEYGMNRTKRGESVTPDKVFIGGVYGWNTLPVPRWKSLRSKHTSVVSNLINDEAARFTASHARPLIQLIIELEQLAKPAE
jgi:hypothetical protein